MQGCIRTLELEANYVLLDIQQKILEVLIFGHVESISWSRQKAYTWFQFLSENIDSWLNKKLLSPRKINRLILNYS